MAVSIEKISGSAYLAFPEMSYALEAEFLERNIVSEEVFASKKFFGDILYLPDHEATLIPYFCKTALTDLFILKFDSITDAVHSLCDIQRNWAPALFQYFRRGMLIQDKMPYVNLKVRTFPCTIPQSPIGVYTLIDEHTIFASAVTTSFLPAGNIEFVENHEEPPSRAYLKLYEALTVLPLLFPEKKVLLPKAQNRCLDAGACPGGWTWVLRKLGASVVAVDRSELDQNLMNDRFVTFMKHDAFTLNIDELGEFDWIFSDVICYPQRLYDWIISWIQSGKLHKAICTIKLQGKTDWNLIDKFAQIPNARICHMNYNKHELCLFIIND
jgi:23S rRNA (cytidine2498-2'-O)-methyltransferase